MRLSKFYTIRRLTAAPLRLGVQICHKGIRFLSRCGLKSLESSNFGQSKLGALLQFVGLGLNRGIKNSMVSI